MVWGAIAGAVAGAAANRLFRDDGGSDAQDHSAQIQREFAQQGVRWRVADAQAAGIHPLFALGAQLPGYQPVHQVGDTGGSDYVPLGQEIGRAIDGTRTASERQEARIAALTVERGELENEILRSQLAKMNAAATPPSPGSAYLIPGQTQSGLVVDQPLERVGASPVNPSQEPGAITDLGFARTGTGLAPVPSKDVKERIEDTFIPELMWSLRNQLLPNVNFGAGREALKPPRSALPAGATHWRWNFLRQEWQAHFPGPSEDVTGKIIRLP